MTKSRRHTIARSFLLVSLAGSAWATTIDGPICTSCDQLIPGVPICSEGLQPVSSTSAGPVRYVDGVPMIRTPSIRTPSDVANWSFYLSYLSRVTPEDQGAVVKEDAGYRWVTNTPRLEIRPSSEIRLIAGGTSGVRFDYDSGSSSWRNSAGVYVEITLEDFSGTYYYVIRGTHGGQALFHSSGALAGKLHEITNRSGHVWEFDYHYGGAGAYAYKLESITSDPTGFVWDFSYDSTSGFLTSVTVTPDDTEEPSYTMSLAYYTQNTSYGMVDDLRYVEVSGGPYSTRRTYFRYHTSGSGSEGSPHDLEFVIGPDNYEALVDEHGVTDLETLSDTDIYDATSDVFLFDNYFVYDTETGHAVVEIVKNGSCNCASGSNSIGRYDFAYSVSSRPSGFSTTYVKVKEKLPDGNWRYLELNRMGSALTEVHVSVGTGSGGANEYWARCYEYDTEGLLTKRFHPSACDASSFSWSTWSSWPTGSVSKRATQGLVEVSNYQKWTGTSRKHSGKLTKKELWLGSSGSSKRTVAEYSYSSTAASGKLMYPYESKVYPASGGTAVTTQYSYTWNTTYPDQLSVRTTTHPAVTKPAGSVSASRTEYYNTIGMTTGRLAMVTDEGGVGTSYSYWTSDGSGRLKETIVDSTGLNLREEYEYDEWGNRTYQTTYTMDGQTPVVLQVRRWLHTTLSRGSNGGDGYLPRDVTLAYEHVTEDTNGNVDGRDGIVRISVRRLDGRTLEEATGRISSTGSPLENDFDSTKKSLEESGAFGGTLFERKSYTYVGPALTEMSEWTDASDSTETRYTTEYQYDAMGRRIWEKNAVGTIRKQTRDALGRVTKVEVGVEISGSESLTTVEEREYDGGSAGGDSLLTEVTRHGHTYDPSGSSYVDSDGMSVRIYDGWNRLDLAAEKVDSTRWAVSEYTYDNLDRVTETASYVGTTSDQQSWSYSTGSGCWYLEEKFAHDERGRQWKSERTWMAMGANFNPATATRGTTYETITWYDKRSQVVKVQPPGLMLEKSEYDAAGRLTASYSSYDADEGDTLAAADDVSGDIVLSEVHYEYDIAGRELVRTTYERAAGETSSWTGHEGALEDLTGYARVSYVATWYTPAGRVEAVADYGDAGGSAPTIGSSPPAQSSTVLVTDYAEGFGLPPGGALYTGQPTDSSWLEVTDPAGKVHYAIFDNLGRKIRVIRNWYSGGAPGTETVSTVTAQRNVTSSFEYDALHRVRHAIAHEYDGSSVELQLTTYEYGVLADETVSAFEDSFLSSNDLLHRVLHGVRSGENSHSRQSVFAYDEQGQVIWRGAGEDDASPEFRVEHAYARDLAGRVTRDEVIAAQTTVDTSIEAVTYAYDSHGRAVEIETLDSSGSAVNTVTYTYDDDGNLTGSEQDHGGGWERTVTYSFDDGSSTGVAYPVPRLVSIGYPREDTETVRSLQIVRGGQPASGAAGWDAKDWVHGRPSRLADTRGSEGSGYYFYSEYMGEGRVLETAVDDDSNPRDPALLTQVTTSTSNPPASIGVDRFGRIRRLYAPGTTSTIDYTYSYDRFHSPVARTDASTLNKSEYYYYDNVQRLVRYQQDSAARTWKLSGVGNWQEVKQGATAVDQRTHNERNEIATRSTGGDAPAYDLEGNSTGLPLDSASSGSFTCTYDGWNRLVKIEDGETPLARYVRDGMGRIVEETVGGYHYHYSTSWQLLSVFEDSGEDLYREYVWGARYVDEILSTIDYSGASAVRRYHVQDANWNVVATWNSSGAIEEYVTYDPYGLPTFWSPYGGQTGSLVSGQAADFLFQGRWLQLLESGTKNARIYHFRNRAYGPKLGRFLQVDPIGVWGDARAQGNGFLFEGAGPLSGRDPSGLACCGLEIGPCLKLLTVSISAWFNYRLDRSERNQVCKRRFHPGDGWDIYELAFEQWKFRKAPCGVGDCWGTAQVYGDCYKAHHVNYMLWGHLTNLCRDNYAIAMKAVSAHRATTGARDEDEDPIGVQIAGRQLWTSMGFYGVYHTMELPYRALTREVVQSQCKSCSRHDTGKLTFRVRKNLENPKASVHEASTDTHHIVPVSCFGESHSEPGNPCATPDRWAFWRVYIFAPFTGEPKEVRPAERARG